MQRMQFESKCCRARVYDDLDSKEVHRFICSKCKKPVESVFVTKKKYRTR